MGNASGHQCKGKISGSEKNVNEKNTYDISPIKRVTKRFLEVSRIVVQNNSKEVYKKSVLHVQSCFFSLIRPIAVFHHSPALPSPLSITRFYIFLNKLQILSRASLLALAKSIYYFYTFLTNTGTTLFGLPPLWYPYLHRQV